MIELTDDDKLAITEAVCAEYRRRVREITRELVVILVVGLPPCVAVLSYTAWRILQ